MGKETFSDYKEVATEEYKEYEKPVVPAEYGWGVRHVQSFLIFVSLSISFIARGHLGVTIVAMTTVDDIDLANETHALNVTMNVTTWNTTIVSEVNVTDELETLRLDENVTVIEEDSSWNVYRTYKWSKSIQEMALGSFFVGYFIMMFPMGLVAQRWGGKIPLQISLLINAFTSILTPWLAVWGGWKAVCCCRILQGLSQAGTYPSIHTLVASWVPVSERGRLSSYIYSGSTFGTVIAFQLGGVLAGTLGWPSIFWMSGILCLITFIIFTIFAAASPSQHRSISDEEKNFIMGKIDDGVKQVVKTPWKAIFTSKRVWASFAAHIGTGVAFVFFFTQVPSYLHYIQKVDIKNNGLFSSLPYLMSIFTLIGFGEVSDYCTNNKILSLKTARRVFNSIGLVCPAICMAAVSFTSSTPVTIVCLVLSLSTQVAMHTGFMLNYIDLAPKFSGTLMATGNTLVNILIVLLPVLVSNVVTDVTNQYQWRTVLLVMSCMLLVCNTIFVVFVSCDKQEWNDSNEPTDPEFPEKEAQKEEET